MNLSKWIKKERKRLYKGCGGFESYWGHQCKTTFTNVRGKKVTSYCDKCQAEINFLKRILKEVHNGR